MWNIASIGNMQCVKRHVIGHAQKKTPMNYATFLE